MVGGGTWLCWLVGPMEVEQVEDAQEKEDNGRQNPRKVMKQLEKEQLETN